MSTPADIVLPNGAATLRFFWVEDRYQHEFRVGDKCVRSITRSDIETPVYTDLHQQGDLLFASGNAGIGHWSAAIEPNGDGFLFDVAIRLGHAAESIASAYAGTGAANSIAITPVDGSAQLTTTDSQVMILPVAEIMAPVCTVCYKYAVG